MEKEHWCGSSHARSEDWLALLFALFLVLLALLLVFFDVFAACEFRAGSISILLSIGSFVFGGRVVSRALLGLGCRCGALAGSSSRRRPRLELFLQLHLAALGNLDSSARLIILISGRASHHLDNVLATLNAPKHDVLAIEPPAGLKSDEKLRSI